jgi:hypothetical protein
MARRLGNGATGWLMGGDPAIRWQVLRDLLGARESEWSRERRRIAGSGWGGRLMRLQTADGTWGGGLYTPKWTSTTYTLLLLRDLGLAPGLSSVLKACRLLLDKGLCRDGGIDLSRTLKHSETCITGMTLSLAAHFRIADPRMEATVDYLLREQMPDGGWNCQRYRGATHGSFHTTISVLEALRDYAEAGGARERETREAESRAIEFLLIHRMYQSHRTGKPADAKMTRFAFPPRWHYDILRGLDYLRRFGVPYDSRLEDALHIVETRRGEEGRWVLQNRYPGRTFFELEQPGQPSRWNTLRALRVLRHFRGA